ncbi:MAG: ABC transporter ATP-binding protein [Candidatus Eisenbacteria bacterium]|nr:ABC transporter ATP-binding protein [Candidatus Eisenbacteria bacterium]
MNEQRQEQAPVVASALTKRFGPLAAVDGIDFRVAAGECVGFLGPNGAGKTTTVNMITCVSPPTSGRALVFGWDVTLEPRRIKACIGVCPQENNLDPDFNVRQNLLVYARYFGLGGRALVRRVDELLEFAQLTEKAGASVDDLSGGMKRRLILARALLNEPRMLVLDEPTTGLDPQGRHAIWTRARQLRAAGTTLLLTTHYMEEATQLCTRVILMDRGRIVLEGEPEQLIAQEIGQEVIELWDLQPGVEDLIRQEEWPCEKSEERLYLHDRVGGRIAEAIGARFPGQQRLIRRASLEDVFLHRTGRMLRD